MPGSSAAVRSTPEAVRSLYRGILRLHRKKLADAMRTMADKFVIHEFHQHKDAEDNFVSGFLSQWTHYRDEIQKAPDVNSFARDLTANELESLSDEQLDKLKELKDATEKINRTLEQEQYGHAAAQEQGSAPAASVLQSVTSEDVTAVKK